MCDATDKDFCVLPCGKKNIGVLSKRKLFARLHRPKCELCKAVTSFADLYNVCPSIVPTKQQTYDKYVKGVYNVAKRYDINLLEGSE